MRTGEAVDVLPESMVEFVQGKHMRVTSTEEPFLTNMVSQAKALASCIVSLDWQVLVAPQTEGFTICDYPFVLVPPPGYDTVKFGIGLGIPGTVKYFPLTRALCLRMGDGGDSISFTNVNADAVGIVNQNVAVNSERFIMGPSKTQLEDIIARSATAAVDPIARSTFEVLRQDPDGALHKFTIWPQRKYVYANI
jgi:Protein of unknown function (DUF4238)